MSLTADDRKHKNDNDDIVVKTSSLSKNSTWFPATIESVSRPTPTVTTLSIRVHPSSFETPCAIVKNIDSDDESDHDKRTAKSKTTSTASKDQELLFSFHPGQWLDFYIPELDKIGGYSITSIPSELPLVELAVKASTYPPAHWVTTKASPEERVKVRVGGDFIYEIHNKETDLENNPQQQLVLFIGGGMGINPLYGMLRQILENLQQSREINNKEGKKLSNAKAALLYSVSNEEERLFREELMAMEHDFPDHFKMYFSNTDRKSASTTIGNHTYGYNGRITPKRIESAIQWLQKEGPRDNHNEISPSSSLLSGVYICGPPGMAEAMSEICINHFHVAQNKIHYEKWW